jgi:hypothetical protein
VLIEFGVDYWTVDNPNILAPQRPVRARKTRQVFAEHLLNNRLQMRAFSATGEVLTLTKQPEIGLCEQIRLN